MSYYRAEHDARHAAALEAFLADAVAQGEVTIDESTGDACWTLSAIETAALAADIVADAEALNEERLIGETLMVLAENPSIWGWQ